MSKNVTLRKPKLLDLDQLLLWENNLENSLFSDNPIFSTKQQTSQFKQLRQQYLQIHDQLGS